MTDSLKVYDILKAAQISDPEARAITQAIKESESAVALDVRSLLDERLGHVATKADLVELKAELKAEVSELKVEVSELKADISGLHSDFSGLKVGQAQFATKADIGAVRSDLSHFATKADLASMEAKLTRWMFVFWMGQAAATFGIILTALKLWPR